MSLHVIACQGKIHVIKRGEESILLEWVKNPYHWKGWRIHMIEKRWRIHIHRKSSFYLPLGSVNLVLKVMGTPDEISSPPGWNRVSPGWPRNFNTELTEPTRQIKTTFPMNIIERGEESMLLKGVKNSYYRKEWRILVSGWKGWLHGKHDGSPCVIICNEWNRYEWVMSHIWMSHVTHMNGSCHESCHTCEWVMSHMWMSHVTHMN